MPSKKRKQSKSPSSSSESADIPIATIRKGKHAPHQKVVESSESDRTDNDLSEPTKRPKKHGRSGKVTSNKRSKVVEVDSESPSPKVKKVSSSSSRRSKTKLKKVEQASSESDEGQKKSLSQSGSRTARKSSAKQVVSDDEMADVETPPKRKNTQASKTTEVIEISDSDSNSVSSAAPKKKKSSARKKLKKSSEMVETSDSEESATGKRDPTENKLAFQGKKLTFGGLLDTSDNAQDLALASPVDIKEEKNDIVKEKRARKLTEKAKYMQDNASEGELNDDSDASLPSRIVLNPRSTKSKSTPVKGVSSAKKVASSSASKADNSKSQSRAVKSKSKVVAPSPTDEAPVTIETEIENAQNENRGSLISGARASPDWASISDKEDVFQVSNSKAEAAPADVSKSGHVVEPLGELPEEMRKDKPVARGTYEPCVFESFQWLSRDASHDNESSMPSYEAVLEHLRKGMQKSRENVFGADNFIRSFDFVRAGNVLNPSLASVDHVGLNKDRRVVVAGSGSGPMAPSVVFLSSGCAQQCNLVNPGVSGTGSNAYSVKKICIWMLLEQFDPMTAFFGKVYEKSELYTAFFNDVLTFSSKRELEDAPPVTPKKQAGLFAPRKSPIKKSESGEQLLQVPPVVNFSDDVPIYDLRGLKFGYTLPEFCKIKDLPCYRLGISDLDLSDVKMAVVTVGYTANAYKPKPAANPQYQQPSGSLNLSLNVQFVMLHGYLDSSAA